MNNIKFKKFTLIELLIVFAIILILISLIQPALSKVRYTAKNTLCVNRLRQFSFATFAYCDDNNRLFPDRGIDTQAGDRFSARWAYRIQLTKNDERLDDMLDPYMPDASPVWCCPMYEGGVDVTFEGGSCSDGSLFGCQTHGLAHTKKGMGWLYMTYSFHGGIKERNYGGYNYAPGDRRKLGDPYIVEDSDGDTVYESGLLFSDSGVGDNAWVPALYVRGKTGIWSSLPAPGITSAHAPPPGVEYKRVTRDDYGILAIGGRTLINYSFDDGAVVTREANPYTAFAADEWTKVPNGRRYLLYPEQ